MSILGTIIQTCFLVFFSVPCLNWLVRVLYLAWVAVVAVVVAGQALSRLPSSRPPNSTMSISKCAKRRRIHRLHAARTHSCLLLLLVVQPRCITTTTTTTAAVRRRPIRIAAFWSQPTGDGDDPPQRLAAPTEKVSSWPPLGVVSRRHRRSRSAAIRGWRRRRRHPPLGPYLSRLRLRNRNQTAAAAAAVSIRKESWWRRLGCWDINSIPGWKVRKRNVHKEHKWRKIKKNRSYRAAYYLSIG